MSSDLLLRGGTVVTMDPRRRVLDADVLVQGGAIAAIGRDRAAHGVRVLDARGCAVIPGIVQAHVHLCQARFRGMADDLPLLEWLRKRIWPLEAAHDVVSLRASARLGIAELLLSGTTALLDMGSVHYTEQLFLAAEEWRRLSAGLTQRARLLDLVIRDLYGPQRLIRQRHLPPEIIYAHPGFVRPFHGLRPETEPALLLYSAELARSGDGQWWVMADRTEAPAGAGYALENRIVLASTWPQLIQDCQVRRLAPFFIRLQQTLAELSPRSKENPRIVLLTEGPENPKCVHRVEFVNDANRLPVGERTSSVAGSVRPLSFVMK